MAWRIDRRPPQLIIITFDGHLDAAEGKDSVDELCAAMGDAAADLVWDVRAMSGYDSDARRAWQQQLRPRRRQIRSITLVGGSSIQKMAARALALVLGIKCRFVDGPEALEGAG